MNPYYKRLRCTKLEVLQLRWKGVTSKASRAQLTIAPVELGGAGAVRGHCKLRLMLYATPTVIKSFVSDSGLPCLLPISKKVQQADGKLTKRGSLGEGLANHSSILEIP